MIKRVFMFVCVVFAVGAGRGGVDNRLSENRHYNMNGSPDMRFSINKAIYGRP